MFTLGNALLIIYVVISKKNMFNILFSIFRKNIISLIISLFSVYLMTFKTRSPFPFLLFSSRPYRFAWTNHRALNFKRPKDPIFFAGKAGLIIPSCLRA